MIRSSAWLEKKEKGKLHLEILTIGINFTISERPPTPPGIPITYQSVSSDQKIILKINLFSRELVIKLILVNFLGKADPAICLFMWCVILAGKGVDFICYCGPNM